MGSKPRLNPTPTEHFVNDDFRHHSNDERGRIVAWHFESSSSEPGAARNPGRGWREHGRNGRGGQRVGREGNQQLPEPARGTNEPWRANGVWRHLPFSSWRYVDWAGRIGSNSNGARQIVGRRWRVRATLPEPFVGLASDVLARRMAF